MTRMRWAIACVAFAAACGRAASSPPDASVATDKPDNEATDLNLDVGDGPDGDGPDGDGADTACGLATCPVALTTQSFFAVERIAVDEAYVYIPEWNEGKVYRVPIDGGEPEVLLGGLETPLGVAVDANSVYVTDYGGGTVTRLSKDGGPIEVLASHQFGPQGLSVDSTSLYWITDSLDDHVSCLVPPPPCEKPAPPGPPVNKTVVRLDLASNQLTVLATLTMGTSQQGATAVDETDVYWTIPGEPNVMKVSKDGGTPVALTSDQVDPRFVSVNHSSVVWLNFQGKGTGAEYTQIMRLEKTGGSPQEVARAPTGGKWFVCDDTAVYWVLHGDPQAGQDSIAMVPVGGGDLRPIATGQDGLGAIAVDANNIYWLNSGMTRPGVFKLPKPSLAP